jgi:hypothetical protein
MATEPKAKTVTREVEVWLKEALAMADVEDAIASIKTISTTKGNRADRAMSIKFKDGREVRLLIKPAKPPKKQ